MSANNYQEQYDRMIRWFNKIQEINQRKRLVNAPVNEVMDEVTAFFQNCYYLKDWIEKDNVAKAKLDRLGIKIDRDFINTDNDMKLLVDLCNGTKHMELDINPRTGNLGRSGENPKFTAAQNFKVTIGEPGGTKTEVDWHIITDLGKQYSVIDLATRCIQKWENFIKNYLS